MTTRGGYEPAGPFAVWIDRTRSRARWIVLGPRPPGDPRTAPPRPLVAAGWREADRGGVALVFDQDFPAPPPEALRLLLEAPR